MNPVYFPPGPILAAISLLMLPLVSCTDLDPLEAANQQPLDDAGLPPADVLDAAGIGDSDADGAADPDTVDATAETDSPGQDTSDPPIDAATSELDGSEDAATVPDPVAPGGQNACGGARELRAVPGEPCGACDDGRWICDGAEALRCSGARTPNVCGGCDPLEGEPGDPCGPCGGEWVCDERTRSLMCEGSLPRNACGGCAELTNRPNFGCFGGLYACETPNSVGCFETSRNACGGALTLVENPGSPCGACGTGRLICDGLNGTECADDAVGQNRCGGCGTLAGVPGEPCGCGGTWTCDAGGIECIGATPTNACGGCAELEAVAGDPCASGEWRCSADDSVQCRSAESNACGGTATLAEAPGTPCGACDDGVIVCAAADELACVGASQPNACGGCGILPGRPGDTCGTERQWECRGEELVCRNAPARNACGGSSRIDVPPGTPCGSCGEGIYLCSSRESTSCLGADINARNSCGGCATLPSGARPGAACGECGTGIWSCDGIESAVCEGELSGTLRTLYADRDGDGRGSPLEQRSSCSQEFGFVTNADDCNDFNDTVYDGADEVCDGVDNNCDGLIDEEFWQYRDVDGDGYGRPGDRRLQCGVVPGWSTNTSDCDDNDSRAFPGQTTWWGTARPDGSYDFDCDEVQTFEFTQPGSCEGSNLALCGIGFPLGGFRPGWLGTPVCGRDTAYVVGCSVQGAACFQENEIRRVRCR